MRSKALQAIIKTLIYSDIFDYPLKSDEIWRFLIAPNRISKTIFVRELSQLHRPISSLQDWYFLGNRKTIVQKRIQRHKQSEKKLSIARHVASLIFFIPTVQLVGLSGALAMDNADNEDDIDLFIITKENTLWLTRLLVVLLLQFLGKRRTRKDKNVSNKICLNMFLDKSSLSFSEDRRDVYTAHEIVQLRVFFERDNTHALFLNANTWVKKFLPNTKHVKIQKGKRITEKNILLYLLTVFNFIAQKAQLFYMKSHTTIEIVSDGMLAFHPIDYRKKILTIYQKRLQQHSIK